MYSVTIKCKPVTEKVNEIFIELAQSFKPRSCCIKNLSKRITDGNDLYPYKFVSGLFRETIHIPFEERVCLFWSFGFDRSIRSCRLPFSIINRLPLVSYLSVPSPRLVG